VAAEESSVVRARLRLQQVAAVDILDHCRVRRDRRGRTTGAVGVHIPEVGVGEQPNDATVGEFDGEGAVTAGPEVGGFVALLIFIRGVLVTLVDPWIPFAR
jgi:hypothetical protein